MSVDRVDQGRSRVTRSRPVKSATEQTERFASEEHHSGPQRLAHRLRQLRLELGLTQEGLAEQASLLDADVTVSVETVRSYESLTRFRSLPIRRPARGHFAIELIANALGLRIVDLLIDCFTDDELRGSAFEWVVARRAERDREIDRRSGNQTLAQFIESLPSDAAELLRLPGILDLRNAEAFAYIFSLEKCFSGLEMSILHEPPMIFIERSGLSRWVDGMGMSGPDRATFLQYIEAYQAHFRRLALTGVKRYRTILVKETFVRYVDGKPPPVARAVIQQILEFLSTAPRFEMVIVDLPHPVDELEIVSSHGTLPSSLDSTVSVLIRQSSMVADTTEYSLVPMPPTYSGLQRDISKFDYYWSLALDQYRARAGDEYWLRSYSAGCGSWW